MRPPSALGMNTTASQTSPPASATAPQHPIPATNGINRAAINISHVDMPKPDNAASYPVVNGAIQVPATEVPTPQGVKPNGVNGSPAKPTAPQPQPLSLAGYNLGLTGQNPSAAALAQLAMQPNGLSQQQMNNLKNVLAQSANPQGYLVPGNANFNMQHLVNNANMNIKLSASRVMPQWVAAAAAANAKAPNGVVNGVDNSSPAQGVPPRAPSTNGTRPNGMRVPSNGQMNSISHIPSHTPPIMSPSASLTQAQSPPRIPITPTLTKASPSLQHSQPSNSKSGY
jgi:enhancer of polycomb-like protein